MTDIVERLRAYDNNGTASWLVPSKAADEIERLEKENESLKASVYGLYELEKELYECQAREAKLRVQLTSLHQVLLTEPITKIVADIVENEVRYMLTLPHDETTLKEFKRKVLLDAANELADTYPHLTVSVQLLRKMAEK